METHRVQIIIEQDEDGKYIAECPALQGCYSQGDTFEEALENVREVVMMCLQELAEDGVTINTRFPEVIAVKTLDVPFSRAS